MQVKRTLQRYLERLLLRLVGIPLREDLNKTHKKLVQDWLSSSLTHKGFRAFLAARDRQLSKWIVTASNTTESERQAIAQMKGRRLEILDLQQAAIAADKRRRDEIAEKKTKT